MAKKYIFSGLALIAVALVIGVIVNRSVDAPDGSQNRETDPLVNLKPSQITMAHLYFSDHENQFLIAEERRLKQPENPAFQSGPLP